MPLTDIEELLFRGRNIVHGVVDGTINGDSLTVSVAPWPDLQPKTTASFPMAVITSKEILAEDGKTEMPWDLLGFDADSLPDQRYRFVLTCDEIELIFESYWPKLLD